MTTGRVNPTFRLEDQKITGLGDVYYNLMEPALIENAAKLVGMPLGPLQLVDETSIDLGVKIAKATRAAMGDAYPDGAVDDVLFWRADEGRMGKKASAGFKAYDDKGKRTGLWPGIADKFGGGARFNLNFGAA